MYNSFDLSGLNQYTDELSFSLISKAVLTTDLMSKINVRTGLSAGTVAINLMDGDLNVSPRSCGFSTDNTSGDIRFTQVNISIAENQMKMEACPVTLRQYWAGMLMSPSAVAGGEELVAEEVIVDYYIKKIKAYNESYLINGDATHTGIEAQVKADSTLIPAGAVAWNSGNAVEQALDLYDAIAEEVKDREDLIMLVSPANYRALTRGLVAAGGTGFFHYSFGDGTQPIVLPGTNCTVVKTSGLTASDFVCAGPAEFIIAGTGLANEDSSAFGAYYDPANDVVKLRAYWRLGVAVSQADLFAHNNL